MKNLELSKTPVAKAEMLIRKPVAEVFEAGAKALLEHGIRLNLVPDRFPGGLEAH